MDKVRKRSISVFYQTTRYYIPENSPVRSYRYKDLRSNKYT
jgi:hypothetical protein